MNAADVMVTADNGQYDSYTLAEAMVAALLAHGEQGQGVAILSDGTLWALDDVTPGNSSGESIYRLLPVSAEAGDTDVVTGDGSGHVLPPFDPTVERWDEL